MPDIKEVAIGTVVHGHQEVLLGKNDRARSWVKYQSPLRYSFYGGKIRRDIGERALDAFMRELWEESGLVADRDSIEKVAMILMTKHLPNGGRRFLRMHVFLAHKASGLLHRTPEMEGWRWCNQRALPHYAMLAADPEWMPQIFGGKKVIAQVEVDMYQRHLIKPVILQEVGRFPEDRPKFNECPSLV
ncbi:MAG: NUDIX domain-containing protein [Candidatus Pacebacteria bacterium]|nr:NUDIX domain-containing protein [Candidatus Paceibacterota bacterium]